MVLNIYSSVSSPRLEYVLDFLCTEFLHCEYRIHSSIEIYQQVAAPFLNYSEARIRPEECFIPACGFLEKRKIEAPQIQVFEHHDLPAFFPVEASDADFPFDLFSLQFYLLSRFEEYLPFKSDQHQRFPATQSLAAQAGFLKLPIVDLWALKLINSLQARFPSFQIPKRIFTFLPTYDIDMAWSYLHKGRLRFLGATLKDLFKGDLTSLWGRVAVKTGFREDPYFTFTYMDELQEKFQIKPLYFWLVGDRGVYDKNNSVENRQFRKLLKDQSEVYEMGLHPSYKSNEAPGLLSVEKKRLEEITQKNIFRSRQHFLKLNFPNTYRKLLDENIFEDYTMGYAEQIGFRASTCTSFYWYDLERAEKTKLKITPFAVMDVTLQHYMSLSPHEAIEQTSALIAKVRTVGGTFSTLWHNSSFSEIEGWKQWRGVYEAIIAEAVRKN